MPRRQPTRPHAPNKREPDTGRPRHAAAPPTSDSVALLPVDSLAIRRKALREHHKAEQTLEDLKVKLTRYHEQDTPGFRQWLHQTFGALLTQQRELEQACADNYRILEEIASLANRMDLSEVAAYRKWLWRQDHPEEAAAEDQQWEEEARRRTQAARENFNRVFGLEEEATDDDDDDEGLFDGPDDEEDEAPFGATFEDFIRGFLGHGAARHRGKPAEHPDDKTVRNLYRTIVRHLHPDHHGQMSEARQNLWHEAQEAYRRGDLNALHGVLARCENGGAGIGLHTPVSLIQRLTRQLKDTIRNTRREVRQFQRDIAWEYEKRVADTRFVRRIKNDLDSAILNLTLQFREMKATLEDLKRRANQPPARPRPRPTPPRQRRQPQRDEDDGQLGFFF